MAQTKKKRSTKHRGNAAGGVESRGRTGRKLTADERGKNAKARGGKPERTDRFDRPPTWTGAAQRSLIAVMIFVAVLVLLFKQDAKQAIALSSVLLVVYIPMSYYTDAYLYKRRKAKQNTPKKGAS
jgi:hypothetical protein